MRRSVVVWLIFSSVPSIAAEPAPPEVQQYAAFLKQRLIEFSPAPFGARYVQDGQPLSMGIFGDGALDVFRDSKAASRAAEDYRVDHIIGLSLVAAGTVASVAGLVVLPFGIGPTGITRQFLTGFGIVAGGSLLVAIGRFFEAYAQQHLLRAVNTWNRDLFKGAFPQVGLGIDPQHHAGNLSLSWSL